MDSSSRLARNQFTVRDAMILIAGLVISFWIDGDDALTSGIRYAIEHLNENPSVRLAIYQTAKDGHGAYTDPHVPCWKAGEKPEPKLFQKFAEPWQEAVTVDSTLMTPQRRSVSDWPWPDSDVPKRR